MLSLCFSSYYSVTAWVQLRCSEVRSAGEHFYSGKHWKNCLHGFLMSIYLGTFRSRAVVPGGHLAAALCCGAHVCVHGDDPPARTQGLRVHAEMCACRKHCRFSFCKELRAWPLLWMSALGLSPGGSSSQWHLSFHSQRLVHNRAGYAGCPHQRDARLRLVQRVPGRAWGKQKGLHEFGEKVKSKCCVSSFTAFLLNLVVSGALEREGGMKWH